MWNVAYYLRIVYIVFGSCMRMMQRLKAVVVVHLVISLVKFRMVQWQVSTSCMIQLLMDDITLLPNLAFCY